MCYFLCLCKESNQRKHTLLHRLSSLSFNLFNGKFIFANYVGSKEICLQIKTRSGGSEGNPLEHHKRSFIGKKLQKIVNNAPLARQNCPTDLRFVGKFVLFERSEFTNFPLSKPQ